MSRREAITLVEIAAVDRAAATERPPAPERPPLVYSEWVELLRVWRELPGEDRQVLLALAQRLHASRGEG